MAYPYHRDERWTAAATNGPTAVSDEIARRITNDIQILVADTEDERDHGILSDNENLFFLLYRLRALTGLPCQEYVNDDGFLDLPGLGPDGLRCDIEAPHARATFCKRNHA